MRNIWDSRARKKGVVFFTLGFLLIGFAPAFAADSSKPSKSTPPKRSVDDVDDTLRAQLSFRLEAWFSGDYACFSFANRSSETISLPGPDMEQPPGRKVYLTSHERFFIQHKDGWKPVYVANWGVSRRFDVPPGTEVSLLISLREAFGNPFVDEGKTVKVCLGKICSEPFVYKFDAPDEQPDAKTSVKPREAYYVDDPLRLLLGFRFECLIPHTRWALFTFVNRSAEIITLYGFDGSAAGKVRMIYQPEYCVQEGGVWKNFDVGYCGASSPFNVHPGTEVTLLVTLHPIFVRDYDKKMWKVRLGNIQSEPFCLKPKPHHLDNKATSK